MSLSRSEVASGTSEADPQAVETSTFSIAHVMVVLHRYTQIIAVSLAAVILGYILLALAYYTLAPSVVSTRLPFRLEFDGAERGQYPNGLKFSITEIVASPILDKAYTANDLSRYLRFEDFKESLFVEESNPELQRLEIEYASRLSDPKLYPVDRERIEREFDLKKESIRRADFALVMSSSERVRRIPVALREKLLTDVLNRWAELADKEKGAMRYRFPVLTTNVVQRSAMPATEHIIVLDILRSRVNRILANIDQLLTIPGAETVRVGDDRTSLEETRIALEDVRRFQIEPLIARVYEQGLISDPRLSNAYFETQLSAAQRELQDAQTRVATLQNALTAYMGRPSVSIAADSATGGQQQRQSAPGGEQAVVPQLSDTFLDRVVKLVSDTQDKTYRQALLDRTNVEAFQRLLPADKEVRYYTALVDRMRQHPVSAGGRNAPEMLQAVETAQNAAFTEVVRNVQQVNDVYRTLSRNLSPETMLYTRTGPTITRTEHGASGFRLFVGLILVTLISLPLILIACLLHARVRDEEIDEDLAGREALARG